MQASKYVTRKHAMPNQGNVSWLQTVPTGLASGMCLHEEHAFRFPSALPFLLLVTSPLDMIPSISEHPLTYGVLTAGLEVTLDTLIAHGIHSTPLSLREAVAQHPVIQQSFQSMASASAVASAAARVEEECRV